MSADVFFTKAADRHKVQRSPLAFDVPPDLEPEAHISIADTFFGTESVFDLAQPEEGGNGVVVRITYQELCLFVGVHFRGLQEFADRTPKRGCEA